MSSRVKPSCLSVLAAGLLMSVGAKAQSRSPAILGPAEIYVPVEKSEALETRGPSALGHAQKLAQSSVQNIGDAAEALPRVSDEALDFIKNAEEANRRFGTLSPRELKTKVYELCSSSSTAQIEAAATLKYGPLLIPSLMREYRERLHDKLARMDARAAESEARAEIDGIVSETTHVYDDFRFAPDSMPHASYKISDGLRVEYGFKAQGPHASLSQADKIKESAQGLKTFSVESVKIAVDGKEVPLCAF